MSCLCITPQQVRGNSSMNTSRMQADIDSLSNQLASARQENERLLQIRSELEDTVRDVRNRNAQIQADMQTMAAKDIAEGTCHHTL